MERSHPMQNSVMTTFVQMEDVSSMYCKDTTNLVQQHKKNNKIKIDVWGIKILKGVISIPQEVFSIKIF